MWIAWITVQESFPTMRPCAREFGKVANQLLMRRILLTTRIVPGGEHCEASWERQLPFCIPTLMYGL